MLLNGIGREGRCEAFLKANCKVYVGNLIEWKRVKSVITFPVGSFVSL